MRTCLTFVISKRSIEPIKCNKSPVKHFQNMTIVTHKFAKEIQMWDEWESKVYKS